MAELVSLFEKAERRKETAKELQQTLQMLGKILNIKAELKGQSIREKAILIEEAIGSAAGHSLMNMMRSLDLGGEAITYSAAVRNCAVEYLGVRNPPKRVNGCELKIVENVLKKTLKELDAKDPEASRRIKEALKKEALKHGYAEEKLERVISTGPFLTLLLAGKFGGFGVYLAATTALAALSEVTGIALSFGAYTVLTKAVSVALGPVGLSASLLFGAYQLGKPAYSSKVLPSILVIATLRQRLRF